MARVCQLTGKKTVTGNRRSHAMNANKRTWKPNLQKATIIDEKTGEKKNILVSARAKKTLKKHNLLVTCEK